MHKPSLVCVAMLLLALPVHARTPGISGPRIPVGSYDLFLSGTNLAWVNFAMDLGPGKADTTAFRAAFDSIRAHGGNTIRVWLHTTGAYTPAFDGSGLVTGPGAGAIENLQTILDLADRRRIGLMLCLWSFDMLVISNGTTVTNRSRLMLTDTGYTRSYLEKSLIPMVAAVRAHPAIVSWEVFNEAEGMSNEFGWSSTLHVPMNAIQRFVNLVAGAIHRTDPAALVTTGAWALIVQTDENPVARPTGLRQALASLSENRKRSMEDAFAARYGFREPASAILARLMAPNYNYYRDDRLIQAGGDSLGTLDFYTVHYYDWQGAGISPFHHPCASWKLTKPLVVAEFFPEPMLGVPYPELYRRLFDGGYAGALSWGWYSGAAGHPQDLLRANTLVLVHSLFAEFPEAVDSHPVPGTIYSFTASRSLLDSGETSVLRWKTALGTSGTLNGTPVASSDSLLVQPAATTTYTLITRGSAADTAAIAVSVHPSGRIISFTASSTLIAAGDPVTLRWSASHASVARLNGTEVGRIDSVVVHPDTTTAYTLITTGVLSDTARITVHAVPAHMGIPQKYVLFQNYPNPFNPATTIRFGLPVRSSVSIQIFSLTGQRIREVDTGVMEAGYHDVRWIPHGPSGVYFCRLSAASLESAGRRYSQTIKLLYLK